MQTTLLSFISIHQHYGSRRIIDTRSIACRYRTIALKCRTQFRQLLHTAVCFDMLVGIEDHRLTFDLRFNGEYLFLEVTSSYCSSSTLVTLNRQFILSLAGDTPLFCDVFSSYSHMTIVKWIAESAYHSINQLSITHTLPPTCSGYPVLTAAHYLCTAADSYLCITHVDGLSSRY